VRNELVNYLSRKILLVNVDEPLTEEQRNERVITRNNNARRQLIPRADVPQAEERREPARYVVERSNSPAVDDDDDDESKFNQFS
jgi:hypothetical protein